MKCIGRPKLDYVNLTYTKNVDRYDYFPFEWITRMTSTTLLIWRRSVWPERSSTSWKRTWLSRQNVRPLTDIERQRTATAAAAAWQCSSSSDDATTISSESLSSPLLCSRKSCKLCALLCRYCNWLSLDRRGPVARMSPVHIVWSADGVQHRRGTVPRRRCQCKNWRDFRRPLRLFSVW